MSSKSKRKKSKGNSDDTEVAINTYDRKKDIMDKLFEEMHLFNLEEKMEDVGNCDEALAETLTSDGILSDSEGLFPSGLKFLDPLKVGCVLCKDDLFWPFEKLTSFNRENIEEKIINEEITEWIRNGFFAKKEINMHQLESYLCDFLFCSFDPDLLACISRTLIELLNIRSFGIFSLLISKIPNWFENLGCDVGLTYGGSLEGRKPDFVQISPIIDSNIRSNIEHTIMVVTNCVSKEMNVVLRRETKGYKCLDDLLFSLFLLAQDPIVVNSFLSAKIKECCRIILELYPMEEFTKDDGDRVYGMVERIGDHWERMTNFPHEMACYLVENIIPVSERGLMISGAVSYFAIMCTMELSEINIINDMPTMDQVSFLCMEHKDRLHSLSCHKMYSILKLLNCCIRHRHSLTERENRQLKTLLQFVTQIHQNTIPSDDQIIKKTMEKYLIRSLNHQWQGKIDGFNTTLPC